MSAPANQADEVIVTTGLVKRYGEVTALDGLDLSVPAGHRARPARPQRRRQDHRGPHPHHAARARRGHGARSPASTSSRSRTRCASASGCPASTPRSTSTSPASRTSTWSAGSTTWAGGPSRERARELLERFDLDEAGGRPAKTYSGGMRRRLDLAGGAGRRARRCCSSTSRPPGSTRAAGSSMWDVIRELVRGGTTLLLTTQYLEEADRLADEIVVIDHGQVHRPGHLRPAEGAGRRRADRGRGRRRRPTCPSAREVLGRLSRSTVSRSTTAAARCTAAGGRRRRRAHARSCASSTPGIALSDVGLRRPTLDDVFLTLTGHAAEEDGDEPSDGRDDHDDGPANRPSSRRSRDRGQGGRPMSAHHVGARRRRGRRQAQPHQDQAGAGAPGLDPDVADHVRAAVRATCSAARSTIPACRLPRVPHRRDLRPDRGVRLDVHRRRASPRTCRRASSTGSGRCRWPASAVLVGPDGQRRRLQRRCRSSSWRSPACSSAGGSTPRSLEASPAVPAAAAVRLRHLVGHGLRRAAACRASRSSTTRRSWSSSR